MRNYVIKVPTVPSTSISISLLPATIGKNIRPQRCYAQEKEYMKAREPREIGQWCWYWRRGLQPITWRSKIWLVKNFSDDQFRYNQTLISTQTLPQHTFVLGDSWNSDLCLSSTVSVGYSYAYSSLLHLERCSLSIY